MEAVLSDIYTKEVVCEDAFACHLLDRKRTPEVVKELSSHLPVLGWSHLKRIKSDKSKKDEPLTVLLCRCHDTTVPQTSTDTVAMIRSVAPGITLPTDALGPLFVVKVPQFAPLTRKQFTEGSVYWPMTFHEDKQISRLLTGDILSPSQLTSARSHMARAWTAAEPVSRVCEGCADSCVVVDPATDTVLVTTASATDRHPLHHAVMAAVDLVARIQGGGVYTYPESCEQFVCRDTELAEVADTREKSDLPYLCTGYDVYIPTEPCVMCAMTLVHSRIRRVFYTKTSPDGALGSRYKIHVQAGLNHHYEVYRGLAPTDTS